MLSLREESENRFFTRMRRKFDIWEFQGWTDQQPERLESSKIWENYSKLRFARLAQQDGSGRENFRLATFPIFFPISQFHFRRRRNLFLAFSSFFFFRELPPGLNFQSERNQKWIAFHEENKSANSEILFRNT